MVNNQINKEIIDERVGKGLTTAEAIEIKKKVGPNKLPEKKPRSIFSIFMAQFKNPLIYIITIAAIISIILAQYEDALIIGVVIAVDCVVGFLQEYKAEKTMTVLQGLLKPTAFVIRDGNVSELEISEIVPGDLVMLRSGDKIAADGNITESVTLSINEAILTGESEPIMKRVSDRAFMGTIVPVEDL
jgi:Ca2+-transporting ATPase